MNSPLPDPSVHLRYNEPAVEARSLHRFFRDGGRETLALRGVSVLVHRGEVVALVGPSGSGKSTLLGCLAGTDEPDGGSVHIAGHRMTQESEQARARLRASRIGLLFQSGNLIEHLTVEQNVALVQRLVDRPRRRDRGELLQSLGVAGRARAYPSELSGGELARAGLAVALANQPVVLLADEPTGELDAATEALVLELLHDVAADGTGVLVASHSAAVAAAADQARRRGGQLMTAPTRRTSDQDSTLPSALVVCEAVCRDYRAGTARVTAVREVSCAVGPATRVALTGRSGSG
jgi:putative ABC transport system ATP-binding protein